MLARCNIALTLVLPGSSPVGMHVCTPGLLHHAIMQLVRRLRALRPVRQPVLRRQGACQQGRMHDQPGHRQRGQLYQSVLVCEPAGVQCCNTLLCLSVQASSSSSWRSGLLTLRHTIMEHKLYGSSPGTSQHIEMEVGYLAWQSGKQLVQTLALMLECSAQQLCIWSWNLGSRSASVVPALGRRASV
jgi:hypothetical protein